MKPDDRAGDVPALETIEALIAAERAASTPPGMRILLQADWCQFCLGPLDVHDVDTCQAASCQRSKETP